ncbi:hypothetical protein SAMD00019534_114250, partial [Acytostelium subglobosum LB1]|uniref:hypothetical protein n=1 Tax=Acytostelium subglobosum LB1 TaxID=1410327 RepID=UPI000644F876
MSEQKDNIIEESVMADSNIQSAVETVNATTATQVESNANNSLEVSIDTPSNTTNAAATNTTSSTTSSSTDSNNNSTTTSSTTATNTEASSNPDQPPSTPLADTTSAPTTGSEHHTAPARFTSVKDIGVSYEKNPRYRRTMEDEHVIIDNYGGNPDQGFYAIYDGHGGRGAVEFTAKTLHKNLLEELNNNPEGDILELIRSSYLTTDTQMATEPIQFSGTTTITAFIRKNANNERQLYIANAGDARSVICQNGVAERLSKDHKGSDQEEIKRISEAGGFVVNNRVNGILAVTRSLGDHSMKEYVVGDPFLRSVQLDQTYTHLILACDGLWDVINDQEAIDLIINETEAQKMSDKLLYQALRKGSTDNISILVIIL